MRQRRQTPPPGQPSVMKEANRFAVQRPTVPPPAGRQQAVAPVIFRTVTLSPKRRPTMGATKVAPAEQRRKQTAPPFWGRLSPGHHSRPCPFGVAPLLTPAHRAPAVLFRGCTPKAAPVAALHAARSRRPAPDSPCAGGKPPAGAASGVKLPRPPALGRRPAPPRSPRCCRSPRRWQKPGWRPWP